ncbi:MAG: thioredoxin domain-containing protein [Gemmatimonadota bacterium]
MKSRAETLMSAVLTVAAVVLTGAVLTREYGFRSNAVGSTPPSGEPELYEDWREWIAHGEISGDDSASAIVIEFADFECPACRRFHHAVLTPVKDTFGASVAVVFMHLPLSMHRFAEPAARASECASNQARFFQFADVVFEKQDSLGLKTWSSYAAEAGVTDAERYSNCVSLQTSFPRIAMGKSIATELGITGTPTVFINGWRFPTPPSEAEMERVIGEILAGRAPF